MVLLRTLFGCYSYRPAAERILSRSIVERLGPTGRMAKITKRTEVTVETESQVFFRRVLARLVWCERCGAEGLMLPPDEAANVAGVSTRVIYTRIEAGSLHFNELPDGRLLVCDPSLGLR